MTTPSHEAPRRASKKRALTTIARNAAERADAARRRGEQLLALIERRKARIVEDFYDIGLALHELQQKKIYSALGFRSFGEVVEKRVGISRSQALKLAAVAASYDREEALRLGLEKAYALVRYTVATPEPDNPKVLLETGAKIGRKPVADASLRDLVSATRAVRAKSKQGAAKSPEAAASEKRARELQAALRKRGARSASVTAAKTSAGWRLRIEIAVADAKRI